jgi:hypothetical protein
MNEIKPAKIKERDVIIPKKETPYPPQKKYEP